MVCQCYYSCRGSTVDNILTEIPVFSVGLSYETMTEHLLSTKSLKDERMDPIGA